MTALFCYSTILTTSTAVYQSKNVSDPTTCVGKENERKTTCLLVHCLLDGLWDTQNQTSITANTVYLHQLCKTRNQRLLGLGFANLENKVVPNWGSFLYVRNHLMIGWFYFWVRPSFLFCYFFLIIYCIIDWVDVDQCRFIFNQDTLIQLTWIPTALKLSVISTSHQFARAHHLENSPCSITLHPGN